MGTLHLIENGFHLHLADLDPGQRARVTAITGRGPFRLRLLELGFVPGTPVEAVGAAPLGGPLRVRVRGALVGLRRVDAARIDVEPA